MDPINATSSLNMEGLLNSVTSELGKGDIHDKEIGKARIISHSHRIKNKRTEYIDNLKKQMQGAVSGGGCFKFLRVVTKVFDFLLKPLSALTMGQFKVELTKTLDMLKDAKNKKALMGLNINTQQIMQAIDGLKKMFAEDSTHLDSLNEHSAKENSRIMEILDEIEKSFSTMNKI